MYEGQEKELLADQLTEWQMGTIIHTGTKNKNHNILNHKPTHTETIEKRRGIHKNTN